MSISIGAYQYQRHGVGALFWMTASSYFSRHRLHAILEWNESSNDGMAYGGSGKMA